MSTSAVPAPTGPVSVDSSASSNDAPVHQAGQRVDAGLLLQRGDQPLLQSVRRGSASRPSRRARRRRTAGRSAASASGSSMNRTTQSAHDGGRRSPGRPRRVRRCDAAQSTGKARNACAAAVVSRVSRLSTDGDQDAADGDRGAASRSGPAGPGRPAGARPRRRRAASDAHPAGDVSAVALTVVLLELGEARRRRRRRAARISTALRAAACGSRARSSGSILIVGISARGAPGRGPVTRIEGSAGGWHDRRMAEPTAAPLAAAQDEVAELLSDLIRIDTTNTGDTATSAGERAAAEWVACKLADVGIESPDLRVRAGPGQPGRPDRGHRPQPPGRCWCTATWTSSPPTRPSGACTRSPARSATATSGAAARST